MFKPRACRLRFASQQKLLALPIAVSIMIHPPLSYQRTEKKKKVKQHSLCQPFFFFFPLSFFCLLLGAWEEAIPAAEPKTCGSFLWAHFSALPQLNAVMIDPRGYFGGVH